MRDAKAQWEGPLGELIRSKDAEKKKQPTRVLGEVASRGLKAESLLGRPEWDWMLAQILERIAEHETQIERLAKQFRDPRALLGADEIAALRVQSAGCEMSLSQLEWLRDLPKEALSKGKEAMREMDD